MSVWNTIKGATGISNFQNAQTAWQEGNRSDAFRQGAIGAAKAGSWLIPVGGAAKSAHLAAKVALPAVKTGATKFFMPSQWGAMAGGAAQRAGAGTAGQALAAGAGRAISSSVIGAGATARIASNSEFLNPKPLLNPADFRPQATQQTDVTDSWQRNLQTQQQSQQAQARAAYLQQQLQNQQRAQGMQDRMVADINASFSPEQRTALEMMGANQRAQAAGLPEYSVPDWISSMAALTPTQSWEFERAGMEADRAFAELEEQAGFERERASETTRGRVRSARQAGAGGTVDMQAALARRGLGSSMATSGVSQDYFGAQTRGATAQARGAFKDFESRLQQQLSRAGAQRQAQLSDLGMARQAQRQTNEEAMQRAEAQYREQWLSQFR
jgi:hypothetical protein